MSEQTAIEKATKECRDFAEKARKDNEAARQPPVITALTGIRADEYNSISLKHMDSLDGDTLYLSIEDGGLEGGSSFFFDTPFEAIAFLKRALYQAELYT